MLGVVFICFCLQICFQVIPFDTASNFLHKRTDLLDTSVSDAELFYGDSDAALPCNMYDSYFGRSIYIAHVVYSCQYAHNGCCKSIPCYNLIFLLLMLGLQMKKIMMLL